MKTKMMICLSIMTHYKPHPKDIVCDMEPKCVPYVKPQTVHIVQRLIGKKMFSISARDTRKQARKLRDELQTVFGRRYRIVTAIIQEGK